MAADLIHILPAWFRPVREFQVIMEAHGAALDQAEKQIRQTWDNCFIQTADADTIRMYEELFGLVYKPGETLEFRRQRILQSIISSRRFPRLFPQPAEGTVRE